MMKLRQWAMVVLVAGCGGSSHSVQYTCDIQTSDVDTCTVSTTSSSKAGALNQTCVDASGVVSTNGCTRAGYLGICSGLHADGVNQTVYEYSSSTTSSVAAAQTACQNLGGTFQANASGFVSDMGNGQNTPVTMSCTQGPGAVCFQFMVSTSAGLVEANNICSQYQAGTPTMTGCSLSPRLGICTLGDPSLGTYQEWFKDENQDAAGVAQMCTQAGGTWQAG